MKKRLVSSILCAAMVAATIAGCGSAAPETAATAAPATTVEEAETPKADAPATDAGSEKLVVGFAQIGQESGWRDAETMSIQTYASEHTDTVELKFADAQQKQENQIKAIKSFIEQDVDVIGLAPVVETVWDQVFAEA